MKRMLAAAVFALVVTGIVGFTTINGAVQLDARGITGVVPIANGGTGSSTQNFVDLTTAQTIAGAKTFSSAATSSVASGSNAFSVATNGARIDFGAGASDYASSDGTTVTFAGPVTVASGNFVAAGMTFSNSALQSGSTGRFSVAATNNIFQGQSADGVGAVANTFQNAIALTAGSDRYVARFFRDGGATLSAQITTGGSFSDGTNFAPMATNLAGSAANPTAIQADSVTLAAGAGTYTFAPAFAADPKCVCTDTTAVAAVKCSHTATTLTVTGTGADVIDFHCIGRK